MSQNLERTLIFLGVVFYIFVFPHGAYADAWVRYLALDTLMQKGELISHKYSMVGPLFSAPLYLLGYVVKHHHWWVTRFNTFLFLGFLWALRYFLKPYFTPAALRRMILLFLSSTMFAKHVTDYYGEVFTVTFAALGMVILSLSRAKSAKITGVLLSAFSICNTPASAIAAATGNFSLAWMRKQWRFLLPLALGALFILAENKIRFGSFFNHDYIYNELQTNNVLPYAKTSGFSYPFFFGLLSILLSFGKGIFFFAPGLLVIPYTLSKMKKEIRTIQIGWIFFLVGLILTYARWCAWHGDWFWGPRYFLFASLPATLALFHFLEERGRSLPQNIGLLLLLTFSTWVGLDGVAFGQNNLELCAADGGYLMGLCWYTPEFSALWRPFIAEKGLKGKHIAFIIYFALVYLWISFPVWRESLRQSWDALKKIQKEARKTLVDWRF